MGFNINIYKLNPIRGSDSYFVLTTGFTRGYSNSSPSDLLNKVVRSQPDIEFC
jgi:hypothetical protein